METRRSGVSAIGDATCPIQASHVFVGVVHEGFVSGFPLVRCFGSVSAVSFLTDIQLDTIFKGDMLGVS